MTRLSDDVDRATGAGDNSVSERPQDAVTAGRRLAVRLILDEDHGPSMASDGGLSPAARRWMESTPGVSVEEARRYDLNSGPYRDVVNGTDLKPRGDPGAEANFDRADLVNTARKALRQYHDLVDEADSGAGAEQDGAH